MYPVEIIVEGTGCMYGCLKVAKIRLGLMKPCVSLGPVGPCHV